MRTEQDEAEAAIAKSLRLRSPAPSVARLSRPALMVSGAVAALALAGAVGWSLIERPRRAEPEDTAPARPTPPERVTGLPKGYLGAANPPPLGPPLPGDLGRPMLNAARQGKATDWPPSGTGLGDPGPSVRPLASADQPLGPGGTDVADRRRQDRRAASQSGLFVAAVSASGTVQSAPDAGAQAGKRLVADDARTTSVERLRAPASPYILQAGAVIPAALVTGLRSDTPGVAIAQVTQDVHDSLGNGVLLIPAGSRLVGEYDAKAQAGQSRLPVVWTRLILPSGRSIVLDRLPAADAQGMAGLQDGVDRHGGRVLAAAGLSTLLAMGAEAGSSDEESDLVRALRRGGAETASDVGRQIVAKSLDLAPTLTIRPGAPLRVLLTRDLVLEPYGDQAAFEGAAR